LWKTFFLTGLSLAMYIFLPFVLAKGMWKKTPALAEGILKRRYWIFVLTIVGCMFTIFSRYSLSLRNNPMMIVQALGGAVLLAVLFLLIGIVSGRGKNPAESVSRVVCMGTANNGLMLILSAQLFSLSEVLIAAMYSIPLFLLVLPYQRYADWRKA
jgi:BASS family bile acid:Na+ symporter